MSKYRRRKPQVISHAYSLHLAFPPVERIEQKETTEQLLTEVVRMDPHHAAASNDLGYTWADEGKNLDRAESLVRVAVEEEPDNQSYLDSMAWVEYKRGKFAEARGFLDRAIGPANRPDPQTPNHPQHANAPDPRSDTSVRRPARMDWR